MNEPMSFLDQYQGPLCVSAIAAFIVAAFFWIVRPLVGPGAPWDIFRPGDALRAMKRDKARILRLIKDLEMERESGATGEAEYTALRERYLREAALVQRRLDALSRAGNDSTQAAPAGTSDTEDDVAP